MKHIILGTAHLKSTPGKCSPDGRIKEYKYSREVVQTLYHILKSMEYDVYIDIPEDDLSITTNQELSRRVNFVNQLCDKFGASNCIYVSIHLNAAGADGKWHTGTGWEIWTSVGQTKADELATCIFKRAEKNLPGQKMRADYSDGDPDKETNYYVLKNTKCAAVLTENFFQDCEKDVEFLLSDVGFHEIIRTHLEGILDYIQKID